ncbi:MAG: trypsin-like serine protease [Oligoflexus sp.]
MAKKVFHRLVTAGSFGILTASAFTSGCGSQKLGQNPSQLQITNGFEIQDDEFPAVVLLLTEGATGTRICTGTFVNDHQVVTAAHCVAGLTNRMPALYYAQTVSDNDGISYMVRSQARRYVIHPLYEASAQPEIHPHDVAIVDFPISTAPAAANLSPQSPKFDSIVTIVGFGDEQSYLDKNGVQSGEGAGVKRFGTNKVQSLENGMMSFAGLPEKDEHLGIGQWAASGSGDSGGPLFYDGKLAGITSGGQLVQGTHGEWIAYSHYVDVTQAVNYAFLQENLR